MMTEALPFPLRPLPAARVLQPGGTGSSRAGNDDGTRPSVRLAAMPRRWLARIFLKSFLVMKDSPRYTPKILQGKRILR